MKKVNLSLKGYHKTEQTQQSVNYNQIYQISYQNSRKGSMQQQQQPAKCNTSRQHYNDNMSISNVNAKELKKKVLKSKVFHSIHKMGKTLIQQKSQYDAQTSQSIHQHVQQDNRNFDYMKQKEINNNNTLNNHQQQFYLKSQSSTHQFDSKNQISQYQSMDLKQKSPIQQLDSVVSENSQDENDQDMDSQQLYYQYGQQCLEAIQKINQLQENHGDNYFRNQKLDCEKQKIIQNLQKLQQQYKQQKFKLNREQVIKKQGQKHRNTDTLNNENKLSQQQLMLKYVLNNRNYSLNSQFNSQQQINTNQQNGNPLSEQILQYRQGQQSDIDQDAYDYQQQYQDISDQDNQNKLLDYQDNQQQYYNEQNMNLNNVQQQQNQYLLGQQQQEEQQQEEQQYVQEEQYREQYDEQQEYYDQDNNQYNEQDWQQQQQNMDNIQNQQNDNQDNQYYEYEQQQDEVEQQQQQQQYESEGQLNDNQDEQYESPTFQNEQIKESEVIESDLFQQQIQLQQQQEIQQNYQNDNNQQQYQQNELYQIDEMNYESEQKQQQQQQNQELIELTEEEYLQMQQQNNNQQLDENGNIINVQQDQEIYYEQDQQQEVVNALDGEQNGEGEEFEGGDGKLNTINEEEENVKSSENLNQQKILDQQYNQYIIQNSPFQKNEVEKQQMQIQQILTQSDFMQNNFQKSQINDNSNGQIQVTPQKRVINIQTPVKSLSSTNEKYFSNQKQQNQHIQDDQQQLQQQQVQQDQYQEEIQQQQEIQQNQEQQQQQQQQYDLSCEIQSDVKKTPEIQKPYFFTLADQSNNNEELQQRNKFEDLMQYFDKELEDNEALELLDLKEILYREDDLFEMSENNQINQDLSEIQRQQKYQKENQPFYLDFGMINAQHIFISDEEQLEEILGQESFEQIYGLHLQPIYFEYLQILLENHFQNFTSLRFLSFHIGDLYDNDLTDDQFDQIVKYVEKMIFLRSLSIYSNELNEERMIKLLQNGLFNLVQLRNLELQFNGNNISSKFCIALEQFGFQKLVNLQSLNLNFMACNIDQDIQSLEIIATGIQKLQKLKSLTVDIRQNSLKQVNIIQFFENLFQDNQNCQIKQIQILIGQGNYLNQETFQQINDIVNKVNSIQYIQIE